MDYIWPTFMGGKVIMNLNMEFMMLEVKITVSDNTVLLSTGLVICELSQNMTLCWVNVGPLSQPVNQH